MGDSLIPSGIFGSADDSDSADTMHTRLIAALWSRCGVFQWILDCAAVAGSFLIGYYLQWDLPFLDSGKATLGVWAHLRAAIVLAGIWTLLLLKRGEYSDKLHLLNLHVDQFDAVLVNGIYAIAILIVVSALFPGAAFPRRTYVLVAPLTGFFMCLSRLILVKVGHWMDDLGLGAQKVVFIGDKQEVSQLIDKFSNVTASMEVQGGISWGRGATAGSRDSGQRRLGTVSDIDSIYAREPFDIAILSCQSYPESRGSLIELTNFCERHGVHLYSVPPVQDVALRRQEVGALGGIPLMQLRDTSIHPIYAGIKRLIDVLGASIMLVGGLPLWSAIALVIKFTSEGPVIFTQRRAGLHGEPFMMYKFRSMKQGAEQELEKYVDMGELDEPVFKLEDDPRVTPFGRFLRKTGFDEVPQFLNVLKGDMSLIGPRPEEVQLVGRYDEWQRRRLKARPGITGLQQVNCRGDTSLSQRVQLDLYYLKYQSLALDIYIILKTIPVILRGEGKV